MLTKPILITGTPRAGTSLTAGVLHICRAWGGEMQGIHRGLRRSLFENAEIQTLCKTYLKLYLSVDPQGQFSLPDLSDTSVKQQLIAHGKVWRESVLACIKAEGYDPAAWGIPWFFKSARMCLLWPMWNEAFPEAKWVLVRRRKHDIVQSCMKTGFMRAYTTEGEWGAWVDKYEQIFADMKASGMNVKEVWPERMVHLDLTEINEVVSALGLHWREARVRSFIAPNLWKGGG